MTLDDRLLTYGGYCSQQIEATDGDKQFFEAKQAILSDLLELIEDEAVRVPANDMAIAIIRNQIRQELREKVKKYCE